MATTGDGKMEQVFINYWATRQQQWRRQRDSGGDGATVAGFMEAAATNSGNNGSVRWR